MLLETIIAIELNKTYIVKDAYIQPLLKEHGYVLYQWDNKPLTCTPPNLYYETEKALRKRLNESARHTRTQDEVAARVSSSDTH